jgi:hypothetical protein
MALGMHVPHFILNVPTKWHTQFQHILSLKCFNFSILSLHEKILIFGVANPLSIRNLQKRGNHQKVYKSHVMKF